jgi:hypothetical protein
MMSGIVFSTPTDTDRFNKRSLVVIHGCGHSLLINKDLSCRCASWVGDAWVSRLAYAIIRLLTYPESAQRMGEAGAQALETGASWDEIARLGEGLLAGSPTHGEAPRARLPGA